jgi:hypothetical protein
LKLLQVSFIDDVLLLLLLNLLNLLFLLLVYDDIVLRLLMLLRLLSLLSLLQLIQLVLSQLMVLNLQLPLSQLRLLLIQMRALRASFRHKLFLRRSLAPLIRYRHNGSFKPRLIMRTIVIGNRLKGSSEVGSERRI